MRELHPLHRILHKITIRFRMALWFFTLTLIASVLALITTTLLTSRLTDMEFKSTLDHTADTILTLNGTSDYSAEQIIDMASTPMYPIRIISDISAYNLSDQNVKTLESEKKVCIRKGLIYFIMLLKLKSNYVELTINTHSTIFAVSNIRILFILIFSVLIGTIFATITSKKMVRPVQDLIAATKKVAKGNFKVRLSTEYIPREVAYIMKNFNNMISELDKMETLRNDFISNVSHEFKTPISSINGFATLLQKSGLSEKQKEYADIIVSESSRLSELSSSILKLSKLENQDMAPAKKAFYLDEQIRQCVLILEKKWTTKNIDLEIDLEKIRYLGDKELLEQVWINLIDNAIKYTPKGGKIVISSTLHNDKVTVIVKDNGIGMNEEVQRRIFEKFYQGDKSHSSEGNGLGLSMVKRILDLCGGQIEVNSEENIGSSFTVTLKAD